jgi:hypothetical protein
VGITSPRECSNEVSGNTSDFVTELTQGFSQGGGNVSPPPFERLLALREKPVPLVDSCNARNRPRLVI